MPKDLAWDRINALPSGVKEDIREYVIELELKVSRLSPGAKLKPAPINERFGTVVVTKEVKSEDKLRKVEVVCDCGATRIVGLAYLKFRGILCKCQRRNYNSKASGTYKKPQAFVFPNEGPWARRK
jgi:hypothetical protein